jgi:VanZ family protein
MTMRPVFFRRSQRPSSREVYDWHWWFSVWAPVLIALAVIAAESTDTFSTEHTSSWLRPLIERWFGVFTDARWDLVHHYIRKSGHFIGYGAVSLTFLRAWLHTLARRGRTALLPWRLESTILAILSTAVVASCDEFHQTFIPSRTGTPVDVLLDTLGATTLCALVWLICWSKRSGQPVS